MLENPKHRIIPFIKKPSTILATYIFFTAVQLGFAVFYREAPDILLARVGGFIVSWVFAYLAWREKKLAVWIMAILILIRGVGGFVVGVFAVSFSQYILKPILTVISIYFIFGGIVLLPICKRIKGKEVSIEA